MTRRTARQPDRLAILITHPIQYYSPWFRHLASLPQLELKVFYLWDFGVTEREEAKFGTSFSWDIPLLDGYDYEFLENTSDDPGTHHFKGIQNPNVVFRMNDWAPDVILIFGYHFATHQKVIRSRQLRRIPMIFRGDSHDLDPEPGFTPLIKNFLRSFNFKRFDRFLTVGQANEDWFANNHVPREKMIRAGHCVDNQRFLDAAPQAERDARQWRSELGIPDNNFVFLFAGKFESKKRPLDLLAAFKKLNRPRTTLLLIGGGEHEKKLREQANEHVIFAPFQNQSQMPKVYAAGDVLVLPSYGRSETWGLAVNEAMNLSRPAIVSTHVGCSLDLVQDEQTGWVFRAGDLTDLIEAMDSASRHPEKTRVMGQHAQKLVSTYSYESAGRAVLQALAELIPEPPAAAPAETQ